MSRAKKGPVAKPATGPEPTPTSVHAQCVAILERPPDPEAGNRLPPLDEVRALLRQVATREALRRDRPFADFDVYVERHIVGVRFMLRDRGRELDLTTIPALAPKEPSP